MEVGQGGRTGEQMVLIPPPELRFLYKLGESGTSAWLVITAAVMEEDRGTQGNDHKHILT
jgi:hypothetical protein